MTVQTSIRCQCKGRYWSSLRGLNVDRHGRRIASARIRRRWVNVASHLQLRSAMNYCSQCGSQLQPRTRRAGGAEEQYGHAADVLGQRLRNPVDPAPVRGPHGAGPRRHDPRRHEPRRNEHGGWATPRPRPVGTRPPVAPSPLPVDTRRPVVYPPPGGYPPAPPGWLSRRAPGGYPRRATRWPIPPEGAMPRPPAPTRPKVSWLIGDRARWGC